MEEGRQLGRYKLVEEIGQGGMAVVWRGVDTTLHREVAVKILHPHLSRKEANRQRFAREARVVATLHHDNIVEIYDFSGGEDTGSPGDAYIVTEYIRGRTLAQFVETGTGIPVEIAVLMVVEICEAVSHAHALGIVHRDIKPENVMIRQDGVLKLMDFGIARMNDDSGATVTGTLMGSPQYMSPEQVSGGELDARSDLFSIAILLYRLVAGCLPFEAGNPAATLRAILESTPTPADVKNPQVGRKLSATIRRALSKNPAERQATVQILHDELLESIADAGLGPAREELKSYFAEPEVYARTLLPMVIGRYATAGHERAKANDVTGAMELWSRVLELDPGNAEVRTALDRLGRGQRNTRVAGMALGGAALLALLGAGGYQGYRWMTRPTPAPTATAVVVISPTPAPPTPVPSPVVVATHLPPSPRLIVTRPPTPTPHPSVSVAAPTATQVAIAPTPTPAPTATPIPEGKGALNFGMRDGATIFIDGQHAGDTQQQKNQDIYVDPGVHPIEIRPFNTATGCQSLRGEINIRAKERTATIAVGGRNLSGPDLYLPGCRVEFRLQLEPVVPLKKITLDGAKLPPEGGKLFAPSGDRILHVEADGYQPFEQTVEFRARRQDDGPQPVLVNLVKLAQP